MGGEQRFDSRPDTYAHISRVRELIGDVITDLLYRADHHDESKLVSPEVEYFDALGETRKMGYLSDEYKASLEALKPALKHHYEANRHHPNHWPNGVRDMSFIDMIEMLCDWKASSERYGTNFAESLEQNQERFGYDDELAAAFLNTAKGLGFV